MKRVECKANSNQPVPKTSIRAPSGFITLRCCNIGLAGDTSPYLRFRHYFKIKIVIVVILGEVYYEHDFMVTV